MDGRRVVVTGAAGRIGRVVVAGLADRWDVLVVGGVSANRYPKVDVAETTRLIGYRPVDDAWA